MAKVIDYYLSLISPWAYLGGPRLMEVARRHRAQVRVKPIALKTVFARTGGLPLPQRAPERQAYRLSELARWRAHLGMPLNLHPAYFPAPEESAACFVIAAAETGGDPMRLAQAILTAVWVEERNIADMGELERLARATGHHELTLASKALEPTTRAAYRALSEEAIGRGVFGSPSYLYRNEVFWGQDRLDFLDRALGG